MNTFDHAPVPQSSPEEAPKSGIRTIEPSEEIPLKEIDIDLSDMLDEDTSRSGIHEGLRSSQKKNIFGETAEKGDTHFIAKDINKEKTEDQLIRAMLDEKIYADDLDGHDVDESIDTMKGFIENATEHIAKIGYSPRENLEEVIIRYLSVQPKVIAFIKRWNHKTRQNEITVLLKNEQKAQAA